MNDIMSKQDRLCRFLQMSDVLIARVGDEGYIDIMGRGIYYSLGGEYFWETALLLSMTREQLDNLNNKVNSEIEKTQYLYERY